jgi:hypothetical protein
MSNLPQTVEDWDKLPQVVKDIDKIIYDDRWMFGIVWGKQRAGKSNLCLKLAYQVYKDWDDVLGCVVFQLMDALIYLNEGRPKRVPTKNGLHNRVPLIIWDDAGAHGNKANNKDSPVFHVAKGLWDTLGTRGACILANMPRPNELTQQLTEKITHELYVESPGVAKYDIVEWGQDFRGWQANLRKDWVQRFSFSQVPTDVYKQYSEMRDALVDELYTVIQDMMANSQTEAVIKRLDETDAQLLRLIEGRGSISQQWFYDNPEYNKLRERISGNKGRGLILTSRGPTKHYQYELTPFGRHVLGAINDLNTTTKEKKLELRRALDDT